MSRPSHQLGRFDERSDEPRRGRELRRLDRLLLTMNPEYFARQSTAWRDFQLVTKHTDNLR